MNPFRQPVRRYGLGDLFDVPDVSVLQARARWLAGELLMPMPALLCQTPTAVRFNAAYGNALVDVIRTGLDRFGLRSVYGEPYRFVDFETLVDEALINALHDDMRAIYLALHPEERS